MKTVAARIFLRSAQSAEGARFRTRDRFNVRHAGTLELPGPLVICKLQRLRMRGRAPLARTPA